MGKWIIIDRDKPQLSTVLLLVWAMTKFPPPPKFLKLRLW